MNKWISECKVGDFVVIDSDVYKITEAKKTQFVCRKFHDSSKIQKIMIKSGKVVGRYNNTTWARVLEGSISNFYAAIEAKHNTKKAEKDARAQAHAEKIANVRSVNSNIIITDEATGGLKKSILVNMCGEPVIVYFTAREEQMWDYSKPAVSGFRIDCNTWAGRHGESYGFSGTQASGTTIEEALIELVADYYWN